MTEKTLDVTNPEELKQKVPDVKVIRDFEPDYSEWEVIEKVSSESQGWMKTTKRKDCFYYKKTAYGKEYKESYGELIQTETQQRNPDGSYSLSQALVFIRSPYYNKE